MKGSRFIRTQVLTWEYLLSIPTLSVRLLFTVAYDIFKASGVKDVVLGVLGRLALLSLTWGGVVASTTVPGCAAQARFIACMYGCVFCRMRRVWYVVGATEVTV